MTSTLLTIATMFLMSSRIVLVRAYLAPPPVASTSTSLLRARRRIAVAPANSVALFASRNYYQRIDYAKPTCVNRPMRRGMRQSALMESADDDDNDFDDDFASLDVSLMNKEDFTMDDIVIQDDLYLVEEEGAIVEEGIEIISSSSSIMTSDDGEDDANTANAEDMRLALEKELRQYRIDQSTAIQKPPYTIFTNAALEGICNNLPTNDEELLEVKGIGPKKMEMYGEDILDMVRHHTSNGSLLPKVEQSQKSAIARPPPIQIESLTNEQRRAAQKALEECKSVFISGAAGTGKTHVSKYILQTLQQQNDDDDNEPKRKCAPTSPTGVAALNIGGSTLHSFFGIGLGKGTHQSLINKVRKNKSAVKRIDETDVLLIDEVSMLSSDLLELIDAIVRTVRHDGKYKGVPMGNMQIIAVGDFFQLPPIISREMMDYSRDVDEQRPYCFDSPVWSDLGLVENTFELSEVQRQESGSKFELFLHMVRVGDVTPNILRDLNRKCLISPERPLPQDGILPTRIYTHNRNVDRENELRLEELEGEMISYPAADEWKEKMPTGTLASIKKNMKASISAELPDEVKLKVGAQVMLTRNKDMESGLKSLVNGSRGVVERFDRNSPQQYPIVRFDNGRVDKIAPVETVRYNPDGGGPGALSRKQLPLKLAWATTVHKSQGCTLTRAILDISKTFEPGQAYVSLSRVKSIDGLFLERPVTMNNILVSERVLNYYYN